MYEEDLKSLRVGRDVQILILKKNHMLIILGRRYQITINSQHQFKKHEN